MIISPEGGLSSSEFPLLPFFFFFLCLFCFFGACLWPDAEREQVMAAPQIDSVLLRTR